MDQAIADYFLTIRTSFGIRIFSAITWLGEWKIIIILAAVLVVIFLLKKKTDFVWPFLASILGGEIVAQLLKIIIHRPRPLGGVEAENTFSFPSGHATIAVAFYGFLAYYIWRRIGRPARKCGALYLGAILILLIGFSRLYLGVHYLSDVIGGFVIGGIFLAIAIRLHRKIKPQL